MQSSRRIILRIFVLPTETERVGQRAQASWAISLLPADRTVVMSSRQRANWQVPSGTYRTGSSSD